MHFPFKRNGPGAKQLAHWLLATGSWLEVNNYWFLFFGYWLLAIVTGYWLTIIAYWLLLIGKPQDYEYSVLPSLTQ